MKNRQGDYDWEDGSDTNNSPSPYLPKKKYLSLLHVVGKHIESRKSWRQGLIKGVQAKM